MKKIRVAEDTANLPGPRFFSILLLLPRCTGKHRLFGTREYEEYIAKNCYKRDADRHATHPAAKLQLEMSLRRALRARRCCFLRWLLRYQ